MPTAKVTTNFHFTICSIILVLSYPFYKQPFLGKNKIAITINNSTTRVTLINISHFWDLTFLPVNLVDIPKKSKRAIGVEINIHSKLLDNNCNVLSKTPLDIVDTQGISPRLFCIWVILLILIAYTLLCANYHLLLKTHTSHHRKIVSSL